jgi:glutamyl-tRNA reductase
VGSTPTYDLPMPADQRPVAVIGLGLMASALARAFISAGHEVTVWNRTAEKARPFEGRARVAGSVPEACATSNRRQLAGAARAVMV